MPKLKLKPHLTGIEIGVGNLIHLKIGAGEKADVAEDVLEELLGLGYFELANDEHDQDAEEAPSANNEAEITARDDNADA